MKNLELKVIAGKGVGQVIVIPTAGTIIGRKPPAELLLDEPAVSRRHCAIYLRRNQWLVEDLDSQNGTLVNGVPVTKQVLRQGDRIQVGETVLRVPRHMLKPAIVVLATAAGLLMVIMVCHWVAARPARPTILPESATTKPAEAATNAAVRSSDSDLPDEDLMHPILKRRSH